MSELKFRAWDKENRTWTFVTLGDLVCGACLSSGDKPLNGSPQVWEQYTGLKDKNGKEIYEGDILKDNTDGIDLVNAVFWCENGGFWGLKPRSPLADRDWGWFIDRNVEVIGNIHENKELLGGEE